MIALGVHFVLRYITHPNLHHPSFPLWNYSAKHDQWLQCMLLAIFENVCFGAILFIY